MIPFPFKQGQQVRCIEAWRNQKVGDLFTVGLLWARSPGFATIDGRFCQTKRFEAVQ